MTNATNVETKHLKVGDVSYAYRELRPTALVEDVHSKPCLLRCVVRYPDREQ